MRFGAAIATLLAAIALIAAAAAPAAAAVPPGSWRLIDGDEFDGSALDLAKWRTSVWYATSGAFAFSTANIAVGGGALSLAARREDYGGKSYTAAAIESVFEDPGNGSYVEIRAKCAASAANVCCAIWEQSSFGGMSSANPEIDIQEYLLGSGVSPAVCHATLHRWYFSQGTHSIDASKSIASGADLGADFHVYGLERRDGRLRFYLDGAQVWEVDVGIFTDGMQYVATPRHIVLSVEGHAGAPVDAALPAAFSIDYVRIYQYDATPPVLTAPQAGAITSSGAIIAWSSDETADGTVEFGTTAAYGSVATDPGGLGTSHRVALAGLAAGTAYHVRVRSRDAAGNLASSADLLFITSSSDGGTIDSGAANAAESGRSGCGSGMALQIVLLAGLLSRRSWRRPAASTRQPPSNT